VKFFIFFSKFVFEKIKWRKAMSRKVEVAGIMGPVWFMGWLFTLGFLKLTFFQGLLALIIWPYYIGEFISKLIV
jgi:hypothetical protein